MNKKVAIIGCGNLGQAILRGLIDSDAFDASNAIATKRNIDTISHFAEHGVVVSDDNAMAVKEADIVIVALKPYNILPILSDLKSHFDSKRHIVISLATGITLKSLHKAIGDDISIFRAMPNTAADVNESLTCICSSSDNSEQNREVKAIFDMIGSSIIIDESLMESATILGACGIAYVLRFIRAMIQGGIEIGFDAHTATHIVTQTVKGASELLITRNQHPEHEIDKVTTPKGCTITGLNEMEHNGFSSALIKGILASYEKIAK